MAKSTKNSKQKWFSNSLGVEWTHELGQRLKAEYKIHNGYDGSFNLQALAEICGHADNASYMNRVFRGNDGAVLREDAARELAEKWGINWRYLYGVGSRTSSDAEKELIAENKTAIEYLKTLGIEFTPGYYWHFLRSALRGSHVDLLEKYIESKKDVEYLRSLLLNSRLDYDDALERVRLCADPTADPKIQALAALRWSDDGQRHYMPLARLDQLAKHLDYGAGAQLLELSERNCKEMPNFILISIDYQVSVDGIVQKVIDFEAFENVLHNVDRMARAAALSALEIQYQSF